MNLINYGEKLISYFSTYPLFSTLLAVHCDKKKLQIYT